MKLNIFIIYGWILLLCTGWCTNNMYTVDNPFVLFILGTIGLLMLMMIYIGMLEHMIQS